jgi:hypothetical protein
MKLVNALSAEAGIPIASLAIDSFCPVVLYAQ